jgi:tryptophan 7-halogenase
VMPETCDPVIERTPPERTKEELRRILGFINDKVLQQSSHDWYLENVCNRRQGEAPRAP